MKDQIKELIILLLFFTLMAALTAGCGHEYHPSIVDIRDQPTNIGHGPVLPDTSQFVPPPLAVLPPPSPRLRPGWTNEQYQREQNHLVKFQAQLRKQMEKMQ